MVCRKRQMVKISDERKFGCFGPLAWPFLIARNCAMIRLEWG